MSKVNKKIAEALRSLCRKYFLVVKEAREVIIVIGDNPISYKEKNKIKRVIKLLKELKTALIRPFESSYYHEPLKFSEEKIAKEYLLVWIYASASIIKPNGTPYYRLHYYEGNILIALEAMKKILEIILEGQGRLLSKKEKNKIVGFLNHLYSAILAIEV